MFPFSLLRNTVKRMYLDGPRVIGGWEGADAPSVCAELHPGLEPEHWMGANLPRCNTLIERKVQSYTVVVETLLLLYALIWAAGVLGQFLVAWLRPKPTTLALRAA